MSKPKQDRTCLWCGNPRPPWNKYTCSKECRDAMAKKRKEDEQKVNKEGRPKPVKYKWRDYKSPITDEEQKALNTAIDNKHNMALECRIIKPWHPEFAEVAKQITPIHLIPKTERQINTFCSDIDPAARTLSRRNEDTKNLRG